MSESWNIGLDEGQRDLLLKGLTYLRSSILLEFREPSPEDTARREEALRNIQVLAEHLNGS